MASKSLKLNARELDRLRLAKGMSVQEVADGVGMSYSRIREAFAGRKVGLKAARAVCGLLGVELAELIATAETPTGAALSGLPIGGEP